MRRRGVRRGERRLGGGNGRGEGEREGVEESGLECGTCSFYIRLGTNPARTNFTSNRTLPFDPHSHMILAQSLASRVSATDQTNHTSLNAHDHHSSRFIPLCSSSPFGPDLVARAKVSHYHSRLSLCIIPQASLSLRDSCL